MLNPSIADELELDPTLRRCRGFSQKWGMGAMLITNLWPLVSPDPKALVTTKDASGPRDVGGFYALNDAYISGCARAAAFTVVGWGTNAGKTTQDSGIPYVFHRLLKPYGPVKCLRLTKVGHPVHPLYLPYESELRDWSP
jgi:hypothetical protein